MRIFQISILILGGVVFCGALFYIGRQTGEDLWKTGVAVLLFDVVCLQLWPTGKRP